MVAIVHDRLRAAVCHALQADGGDVLAFCVLLDEPSVVVVAARGVGYGEAGRSGT